MKSPGNDQSSLPLLRNFKLKALVCLAPPSGRTWKTTSHLPFTELALFYFWIVQLLSCNWINTASLCMKRATVVYKHWSLVLLESEPAQNQLRKTGAHPDESHINLVWSLSLVRQIPCCAKNTWRGDTEKDACIVPQRGGMMHSMPLTAELTRKPHSCKLPHFTLSKGAKEKTKTDFFDFWENFSHGSIKQSTCTYHTLYSFYEMLLPRLASFFLFFCCQGQLSCRLVLLCANACMMLTAISTEER